jgi:hypothetical protein
LELSTASWAKEQKVTKALFGSLHEFLNIRKGRSLEGTCVCSEAGEVEEGTTRTALKLLKRGKHGLVVVNQKKVKLFLVLRNST